MKKAVLDTSFILSCIREKIDFFEELKFMGFSIIIPNQVISEIENIKNSNKKLKFKDEAAIALKLLKSSSFSEIDLKTKNVDSGIIKFAKKNPEAVIATLDREIKFKVKNPKIVVRGRKKLEII